MKKMICVVLCLLLAVPCALAESQPKCLTEDDAAYAWICEKSTELAGRFNEALHSEGYVALFTSAASFEEELKLLRMQDFTKPIGTTAVRADQAIGGDWMQEASQALESADLSLEMQDMIWARAYHQAGMSVIARNGETATVALASALAFSDAWVRPECVDGPCFTVMYYGGLYAFLCTFVPNENGVVTAHAQFIPSRAADGLNLPVN